MSPRPSTSSLGVKPPVQLLDLGPTAQLRAGRLRRRLTQLVVGLWLFGVSLGLMVQGTLGVAPWDVLHLALTRFVPLSLGQVVIAASLVVLVAWIPLREKPGLGTVANAVVVGLAADATLAMVVEPDAMAARLAFVVGGVVLNGVATALYIGAQFGRGPRDGLMTGLARRTGTSLRLVRTIIEVVVVVLGLLLGGRFGAEFGVGTVLYALAIGPLAQAFLPYAVVDLRAGAPLEPSVDG